MLSKIEITNFKNFDNQFSFDLSDTKSFEFNKECVSNGIVNKALIYGHNGIGKSNLGFAIFDLIFHLTDRNTGSYNYFNYLNANNDTSVATFKFDFKFDESIVEYQYTKTDLESIVTESIKINGKDCLSIDRTKSSIISIDLNGAETLKNDIGDSKISIVNYVNKNAILEEDETNKCFKKFIDFVNGMLFFRSLEANNYIGIEQGSNKIGDDIIKKGHLKNFETFLNEAGIECKLGKIKDGDEEELAFKFGKKLIPFYDIASQGSRSLALFYYWFQRLEENKNISFVFIDEFDAFYHHSLSALIVKKLKKIHSQVIITTHNTSIMSNDLLRPDCYFLLKKGEIKSLSKSTQKELRIAHNIEKMYKAGAFV